MTFIAATVTKTGAVISQDSMIYAATEAGLAHARRHGGLADDGEETAASCFVGGGGPASVKVLGNALKIMLDPRRQMALGGTGRLGPLYRWFGDLASSPIGTICGLNAAAPKQIAEACAAYGGDELLVVHAGFDPMRGTGIGFTFSSDHEFDPREIAIGTTLHPPLDIEAPDYPEIYDLSSAAREGLQVRRFHASMHKHLLAAFAAGRLAPGVGIGRTLHHVEVTADAFNVSSEFA